jgi:hypothetical protein
MGRRLLEAVNIIEDVPTEFEPQELMVRCTRSHDTKHSVVELPLAVGFAEG